MFREAGLGVGDLLLLLGDLRLELVDARLDLFKLSRSVLALGLGDLKLTGQAVELRLHFGKLARDLLRRSGVCDGG